MMDPANGVELKCPACSRFRTAIITEHAALRWRCDRCHREVRCVVTGATVVFMLDNVVVPTH
jgi:hypothetical protein